jgi:hypothetical protein
MSNEILVIRSRKEIEERYFPKALEIEIRKRTTDPRDQGINLAKESLERFRNQLI